MLDCRRTGTRAAPAEPPERPAGAATLPRRPCDEPPTRRFRDLLESRHRDTDEAHATAAAAGRTDPAWLARLQSATTRESPATSPPAPAAPDSPAVPLADVSAAAGPDGAALRFTIDDGFLAGSRMAFLLRGDALELAVEAPGEEVLGRLRAREDELRAALAARGLELERFEAGHGGREQAGAGTDDGPGTAAARRARDRRRAGGERGT